MLDNAGKSKLDYARDGSAGGTTSAVVDCSIVTFAMIRTSAGGAIDGTAAAPSSSATPASTDGTSGSIVAIDNAKIGSEIDADSISDSLAGADEAAAQLLLDSREGPASDAAFFLTVC